MCPIDIGRRRVDPYDLDVRSKIDQDATEVAGAAADVEHAPLAADSGKRDELGCKMRAPAAHEALISRWIGVGHACTLRVSGPDEGRTRSELNALASQ